MAQISSYMLERRKGQIWILHLFVFLILFSIPLFVNPSHNKLSLVEYFSFVVPLMAFMVVFYINYFLLMKKFLFKRKIGLFVLINVLIISILAIGLYIWGDYFFNTYILPKSIDDPKIHDMPWYGRVIKDIFFMIMALILSLAIKMTGEWSRMEREHAKIESIAYEAELKNLKSQLNPHFLFNTLNNIYSLMRIDIDKAQKAIMELSKILRYVLSGDSQERALLKDEISFTKNYIELMSLRLSKKIPLTVNIQSFEQSTATIAPLMFISLVENAFKHGIFQEKDSFIDINIHEINQNSVSCEVTNSYFPKDNTDNSGSGIGIENLKKRLSLLYPGRYSFAIAIKDNIYSATLTIDLQ